MAFRQAQGPEKAKVVEPAETPTKRLTWFKNNEKSIISTLLPYGFSLVPEEKRPTVSRRL